ncbi:junctional adhesion molecule-like [Ictalurus furcatus]|uniref:junctional adhesion molecule-like n=1 Tax=Ictalurus furcatus TaxID=66913 RepID=UPI0023508F2C|nr:junctional adhesion molecule-like [Ictalurus furcatus]
MVLLLLAVRSLVINRQISQDTKVVQTGPATEILNDEHYRGRLQLFNHSSPANLSLLISDLREEDVVDYRCSTEKEHRDIKLHVKGCSLSADNQTEITGHKGGSVLLPCSCSDLNTKPQKFTYWTYRTGSATEVLNGEHYRDRHQLFNHSSPANLSLLISDLREEDHGVYRCSTEKEYRDIRLNVKGCELVKTGVERVTMFTGESVVLPCVCTDLQDKPISVKWEFSIPATGIRHFQEIYPKQTGHHRNRVKLVSNNAPGNLSLLISDLTEEDQGDYRCSVQDDSRDVRLSVKGGRCGEDVITEGRPDCKRKPEDQTEPDLVTFCTK